MENVRLAEGLRRVSVTDQFKQHPRDYGVLQTIHDKLDELKATVNISAGGGMNGFDNSMDVRISTDRQNLPAVIHLVFEILSRPSFPENEFEIVKNERMASLKDRP